MSLRDVELAAKHEARLVLSNPTPLVILVLMPTVLILFLKNGMVAPTVGSVVGNSANQAVPGIATMFAFFLVGYTGLAFYREHGWNTWERLRVSPLSTAGLVVGKALPYLVLGTVQVSALGTVGWLFLGMEVRGSVVALLALVALLSMAAVSLGLFLTALLSTAPQLWVVSNLAAVLLGGIGGAFAPTSTYPSWMQVAAHATPQFWAIDGFKQVMLGGSSIGGVMANVIALLAFSALFTVLAVLRFDVKATKRSFLE